jgi:hypothetical protein
MLPDNVIIAVMTSSVTGAGLVIAFYALLANMSEKVFVNRLERISQYRREIKRISSNPQAFSEENLKKTTEKLDNLRKRTDSVNTFPRYLGFGIVTCFVLFVLTAIFCFNWLGYSPDIQARAEMAQAMIIILFSVSLFAFLMVGVFGIIDVLRTLWSNFEKIRKEKQEVKAEIDESPKYGEISFKIIELLDDSRVPYETNARLKTNGSTIFPDIIVSSADGSLKYVIQIMTRPSQDNIYKTSEQYQASKEECNYRTILVADFQKNKSLIDTAKTYWDFVIDFRELGKLLEIVQTDGK